MIIYTQPAESLPRLVTGTFQREPVRLQKMHRPVPLLPGDTGIRSWFPVMIGRENLGFDIPCAERFRTMDRCQPLHLAAPEHLQCLGPLGDNPDEREIRRALSGSDADGSRVENRKDGQHPMPPRKRRTKVVQDRINIMAHPEVAHPGDPLFQIPRLTQAAAGADGSHQHLGAPRGFPREERQFADACFSECICRIKSEQKPDKNGDHRATHESGNNHHCHAPQSASLVEPKCCHA